MVGILETRRGGSKAASQKVKRGSGRGPENTGIRDPGYKTYSAVEVPHVGPQRKQSQAANYERLAADLGRFNSALGQFASGVEKAAKKAEARAKKLEAEKKAAEARKKRMSRGRGGRKGRKGRMSREQWREKKNQEYEAKHTLENRSGTDDKSLEADPGGAQRVLGRENATFETYKELNDLKKGAGNEFFEDVKAETAKRIATGYKVKEEDEHGNAEQFTAGQKTGIVSAPTPEEERNPALQQDTMRSQVSGEQSDENNSYADTRTVREAKTQTKERLLTYDELHMEAYKRQKVIDEKFADKPLIRRHFKMINARNLDYEKKALEKAELAENKVVALETAQNTAMDVVRETQGLGLDPDKSLEALVENGHKNATVLSPGVTKQEVLKSQLLGLEAIVDNPDTPFEDIRGIMNLVQGSPDRGGGIPSILNHRGTKGIANRLIRKSSERVAKQQAGVDADLAVGVNIAAKDGGKPMPGFKEIEYEVNGRKVKITVAQQEEMAGSQLDARVLAPGGVPLPKEAHGQIIPKLVDEYEGTNIPSPYLQKALGVLKIKKGEKFDPSSPAAKASTSVAMTLLSYGEEGRRLLHQNADKGMVGFYEHLYDLRRNGIVSDAEVGPLMQKYVDFKRGGKRPTLGSSLEGKLSHWRPEGFTKTQIEDMKNTVRLSVIDEGKSWDEIEQMLGKQVEKYREYNPSYNGQMVEINPAYGVPADKFIELADTEVTDFKKKNPQFKDKDIVLERYGQTYYMKDKKTGTQIMRTNKDGDLVPVGFNMQRIADNHRVRGEKALAEANAEKAKSTQRSARMETRGFGSQVAWGAEMAARNQLTKLFPWISDGNKAFDDWWEETGKHQAAEKEKLTKEAGEFEKIIKEHPAARNTRLNMTSGATSDRGM